jgi:hypothetical protein
VRFFAVLACLCFAITACQCGATPAADAGLDPGSDGGLDAGAPSPPLLDGGLALSFGADVRPAVRARLEAHLRAVVPDLVVLAPGADPQLANGATHLCFGKTSPATRLNATLDASKLADEGFIVRVETPTGGSRAVAVGRDTQGTSYAAYALLEAVGFTFLHPLAPTDPPALTPLSPALALREVPRWRKRTIHLHTQHPLELTDLLQGWGPLGPDDAAGFTADLPRWDTYLEWLLANRQNGVEWFLLYADSWKTFADSTTRRQRLRDLVDAVHAMGLRAGLDVPIVFGQQHAFRLLRTQNPNDKLAELAELHARLDWVLGTGVDFLGTESGTSEFTAPDPQRMLDWMNAVTEQANGRGVEVFIKVHASTGQGATGFVDPGDGGVLNFNFLPHYASPQLGVLPHTVQVYGLADPAPVYGNTDFSEVERFITLEAGKRPIVWYPETAYWVSVDIDVPLFLPLYAQRRLLDLRRLAARENTNTLGPLGTHLDGQLVFSSGWEWGYWLNDVVAARAAWDPAMFDPADVAFQRLLAPALRAFGPAGPAIGTWLADVVAAEEKLLIFGEVAGLRPSSITQRNGLAYLSAWDTWDDVSKLTGALPATQPDRLGLVDLRNPLHGGASYTNDVKPLLAELDTTFSGLSDRAELLRPKVPVESRPLFDDLADAAKMTALRARQVRGLYAYVDGFWDANQAPRRAALATARTALDDATAVVRNREAHYRVPADRIAAWQPNPTAYPFRYLWMVRSLYGWWRDEGKAVDAPLFPCYLNVINPVDVAFGEGMGTDAARLLGGVLSADQQRGCFAEPSAEPTFPQDNLRSRP